MIWQTVCTSSAQTEQLGARLGALLKGGEVLELVGDLGSGKTTFVKGLATGLESDEQVNSPTFTISRVYQGRDGIFLHHFDFYRLAEPGIMKDELAEIIDEPSNITAVEWPENVNSILPDRKITIEFNLLPDGENTRQLTFKYTDANLKLVETLNKSWGDWKS